MVHVLMKAGGCTANKSSQKYGQADHTSWWQNAIIGNARLNPRSNALVSEPLSSNILSTHQNNTLNTAKHLELSGTAFTMSNCQTTVDHFGMDRMPSVCRTQLGICKRRDATVGVCCSSV
mmetsp:Transcript_72096/g.127063  ORF Transcript_72096/g.127063 Transcript_72096/m.127063 type:complete len:120 (+) Transcript_72096:306-665(+)